MDPSKKSTPEESADELVESILNDTTPVTPAASAVTPTEPAEQPMVQPEKQPEAKPVVEPTPTPVPATAPVPEPVSTPVAVPKKKRTNLIISAIIAAVLVVAGAVSAFLYFSWKNSPEIVALDAVTNLINVKSATVAGDIKIDAGIDDESIQSAVISLNANVIGISSSASASIAVTTEDDKFTVSASEVMLSDGKLYLNFDGLDNYLQDIDDTWWEVDVPEIAKSFENFIGASMSNSIAKAYNCLIDYGNSLSSNKSGLAEIYQNHQFITIAKSDFYKSNGYKVTIDEKTLKDFKNELNALPASKTFRSCVDYNLTTEIEDYININVDKSIFESPTIYFAVNNQHEISELHLSGNGYSADLKLTYPATSAVSAPAKSESISELIKGLLGDFYAAYQPILNCDTYLENCGEPAYSVLDI